MLQQFRNADPIPYHSAKHGEEPCEAVRPASLLGLVPQQYIQQQRRPELPANGVFVVPEEVADAEGLFDLLEEDLDAPAAFVERADGAGGPLGVVGDEGHQDALAVEFDEHFHPPQLDGILTAGFGGAQDDKVVALDVALGFFEEFPLHGVGHVVLGAGDPVDAALMEGVEVQEVDVGFVEEDDLAVLEVGAELLGACIVVVAGFLDDGAGGKESLQVEAQVHFGRGFAAAVLGPVHGVGNQGDGAGIDGGDGLVKTAGQALIPDAEASGRGGLEMFEGFPEEFLHHIAVAGFVRVGEGVLGGRRGTPDGGELGGVVRESVADIIEPHGVGELGVNETHDMAPRAEGPSLLVDTVLAGELGDEMFGYELANSSQYDGIAPGWLFLFHQGRS